MQSTGLPLRGTIVIIAVKILVWPGSMFLQAAVCPAHSLSARRAVVAQCSSRVTTWESASELVLVLAYWRCGGRLESD